MATQITATPEKNEKMANVGSLKIQNIDKKMELKTGFQKL
jgi:hypothetical protein